MAIMARKIGEALVPGIGFGAMGISAAYGAVESDEERFKVLDAAYAGGSKHWDTARLYGDSEELLGKWFNRTGKRSDIFLATKFGIGPDGVSCGDPEFYIDLYYQHRVDSHTPIEVTVGAMAELVKEGKVKYLGLSECSAKTLRRAHAVHPISALQIEYSPFVLDIEDPKVALLETARELGVTIIAYSPIDWTICDFRRTIPKYSAANFPKILAVVEKLKEIGHKHNATSGQVTLAWILAQGPDFVVIPGTKKIKYLEENLGAAAVKLSSEELTAVRKISEESNVPGNRYNDAYMAGYCSTPLNWRSRRL
ncbi:NADP-dependent oxidoreductase domain-containing protein [Mycena epipterygia]|nr:NADP-dependent oxidoreductase domain-containing protein [Mycena epipterygia]